jgi:hypothetical protein
MEEGITSTHGAADCEMLRADHNRYVHGELITRRKMRLSWEDRIESET